MSLLFTLKMHETIINAMKKRQHRCLSKVTLLAFWYILHSLTHSSVLAVVCVREVVTWRIDIDYKQQDASLNGLHVGETYN